MKRIIFRNGSRAKLFIIQQDTESLRGDARVPGRKALCVSELYATYNILCTGSVVRVSYTVSQSRNSRINLSSEYSSLTVERNLRFEFESMIDPGTSFFFFCPNPTFFHLWDIRDSRKHREYMFSWKTYLQLHPTFRETIKPAVCSRISWSVVNRFRCYLRMINRQWIEKVYHTRDPRDNSLICVRREIVLTKEDIEMMYTVVICP